MRDWKATLEGLSAELRQKEQQEQEAKTGVLKAFRRRLAELEPIIRGAAEFGDAFGVECDWEVSRFDQRYPFLRFQIRRPRLLYEVECRDGQLRERLQEGEGGAKAHQVSLEELTTRRLEERLNRWVQRAAEANRKLPWKR